MLYSLNKIVGSTILATDGEIGKVAEFYFDDANWIVRYVIVNTENWMLGRQVLISPSCIERADPLKRIVSVKLSCEQVKDSPDIDTSKPVYRQHETELSDYYQWPLYWTGDDYGGSFYNIASLPPSILPKREKHGDQLKNETVPDPHLRSTDQVTDYHIQAIDGEIGHVEDFLINPDTWAISSIVVKTRNWLPGKRVLISPRWLKEISWENQKVYVDKTVAYIKTCPEYDAAHSG